MARNDSRNAFGRTLAARHTRQVQLLVALIRSLRRVELCRRDFVLLLGTEVPLSSEHQQILREESMLLHPTPPIIPGVPTADKLLVWRLTQYSQLAVVDADVMFVRPIDSLFARAADGDRDPTELTIAHHPYDHLQAQCGVPVSKRGIAALFVVRPKEATYRSLMAYLLRRFKAEQLLYSDQTGIMCYFGNRSQTLPCPFVYDVSMTVGGWLPTWTKNCRVFVRQHVLKNCLPDIPDKCRPLARRQICDETSSHVREACDWSKAVEDRGVHAVHFKGSAKPWRRKPWDPCRYHRFGMPGVRPLEESGEQTAIDATDSLEWNATALGEGGGSCLSANWKLPVFWARRKDGEVPEACCSPSVLFSSQWSALLQGGRMEQRLKGLEKAEEAGK